MTAPIYFSLREAEAAEDRAENGVDPQPGDKELITALEGYRQQQWDNYWIPIHKAEYERQLAEWLATQCPGCEDGGTAEPCDEHEPDPDDGAYWSDVTSTWVVTEYGLTDRGLL